MQGRAAGAGGAPRQTGPAGRRGGAPRGDGARQSARGLERDERYDRDERAADPARAQEHDASRLDPAARARLRTLTRENAEVVARHLVAAGLLMDEDPEQAYAHALAAQRRAGRVDVVREAVGLTAYAAGRFAEALRELRTARRLGGQDLHRAVEADCERALGRPERALALAAEVDVASQSALERVELAIVVSGARVDLGEPEAALAVLEASEVRAVSAVDLDVAARVASARADVLDALGRHAEAAQVRAGTGIEDDVVVVDVGASEETDSEETDSEEIDSEANDSAANDTAEIDGEATAGKE